MHANRSLGGDVLGDYRPTEYMGLRIEARPLNWRGGIPLFRKMLQRITFFSGATLKFEISVKPITEEAKKYSIKLHYAVFDPSDKLIIDAPRIGDWVSSDKKKQWTTNSIWFGQVGRYGIRASYQVKTEKDVIHVGESTLAGFDVMSSDSFFLWAAAIILSAVSAFGGSIGGGLLVQTFAEDDYKQPIPVIIIATPTPVPIETVPVEQSGPNSNVP